MSQLAPFGPKARRIVTRAATVSPLIIREVIDLASGVRDLVVHPAGEVDLVTSAQFQRAVFSALDRSRRVCLDLAEVTFFDILGLRTLNEASRRADDDEQAFWLRNPSRILRRVMVLSDMDRLNLDNPMTPRHDRESA